MKTEKIKRYRCGVSRVFPTTHPKKGELTYFVEKIQVALEDIRNTDELPFRTLFNPKLHTCRANFPLWEKRMKEVQAGRAVIELFYWEGKPYRSKQVVFATLDNNSGCGVQELSPLSNFMKVSKWKDAIIYSEKGDSEEHFYSEIPVSTLAENDGLSFENFEAWFKGYDLSEPMAIIQFTKFRY
jgi:hypothetical protein